MNTFYLKQPIEIPDSDYSVVALSPEGSPYVLKTTYFTGIEEADLSRAFLAIPFFTRKAESDDSDEIPDYEELMSSTRKARKIVKTLYGITLPETP